MVHSGKQAAVDTGISVRFARKVDPPRIGSMVQCFDLASGKSVVALVGAGGKTSLMYRLARQLVWMGKTVVTTTTTKIFPPTGEQSPSLALLADDPELSGLEEHLDEVRHVTVASSRLSEAGKLQGVEDKVVSLLGRIADYVLVEADGAAGRAVKAPAEWEPVIPSAVSLIIPVVGLDSLGKPATDQWVFRLERFYAVTGLRPEEEITPKAIARLLCHPEGGLKHASDTKVIPFLNKLDVLGEEGTVRDIARMIEALVGTRISALVTGSAADPG